MFAFRSRNTQTALLLAAPALLLIGAFYIVPVVRVLALSFLDPEPGFANYELLWTSSGIHTVLAATTRICLITTAIAVPLGYAVAYVITTASARMRALMLYAVLLPLWVSALVRSFVWVTLLQRRGIVNQFLQWLGVIHEPLPLIWNEFGVIVGMTHYMIPYAVLPLLATMAAIDLRLVDAARGMGASKGRAFREVFLPLSAPGIAAAAILVLILTFGFYITPAILGGGRTTMIAQYITTQILVLPRWGVGAMLATVLVVVTIVLLAILARFFDPSHSRVERS
ncbi:ABC transporter permease subunit (plasmid) [Mesorhizobium sp. INR15]|nr:ABC transporter permease subunit [Mesorhizobium sp. INR15]